MGPHNSPTSAPAPKACSKCGVEKPYDTTHFPARRHKPFGAICRVCFNTREREAQRRTENRAKITDEILALPAAVDGALAEAKTPLPTRKLHAELALNAGAAVLNAATPVVVKQLITYATDPASPHHEWAVKFVAERAMPKKLYEELGAAAAGVAKDKSKHDRPPVMVVIQAGGAVPAGSARVIEAVRTDTDYGDVDSPQAT